MCLAYYIVFGTEAVVDMFLDFRVPKGLLCDAKIERKDMGWSAMIKENINLTFITIYQEDLGGP